MDTSENPLVDADQSKRERGADPVKLMRLMFSPMRTQPSDDANRILDQASVESDVVDGSKIVHYIWGNEERDEERRVLLAHGWSGNAGHMTSLANALVTAGFKVVAVDQPGHGRSEGEQSSVIHFAKAIKAANQRYGPFYAVVAHSLSAAATTYALSRGLGCESAVFFNPVGSFESVWRRSEEMLGVSSELIGLAAKHAENWLGISFANIEPSDLARGLSTRLLVIHDKCDKEAPISDIETLVESWPNAQLIKVEKLGHTRILSNDNMVRRAVDFVTAQDGHG